LRQAATTDKPSFNGKLSDEWLNREIFYTSAEAKILIEKWKKSSIKADHIYMVFSAAPNY